MSLTICLITRGRQEYLSQSLESYEKFIDTGDVSVILVDNGSDFLSQQILLDWQSKYSEEVFYIRSDINQPVVFPFFWDKIKSLSAEWILFPGDDDILVFDIYKEWIKELKNDMDLNAFAPSAQIIDGTGKITGEVRYPAINMINSQIELLARSLHEPPFVFPCLFIRIDAIPHTVIYSKFVFDWWLGLQLVLKGNVKSTKSIGINYRVHEKQMSFEASSRRKYFEGYNMLITVINSVEFEKLLESTNILEIEKLLSICIETRPLYAQPDYYISLIKELSFSIAKVSKYNYFRNGIAETYVLSSGIYTKKGDLENLYTGLNLDAEESSGNLALFFSENVCKNLCDIGKFFNESAKTKVSLSCKHSKANRGSVLINCTNFNVLNELEISESVLISINDHLENNGLLSFTISPFERALIVFYRKLKLKIPKVFKKYLFNLKKSVGIKNEF